MLLGGRERIRFGGFQIKRECSVAGGVGRIVLVAAERDRHALQLSFAELDRAAELVDYQDGREVLRRVGGQIVDRRALGIELVVRFAGRDGVALERVQREAIGAVVAVALLIGPARQHHPGNQIGLVALDRA